MPDDLISCPGNRSAASICRLILAAIGVAPLALLALLALVAVQPAARAAPRVVHLGYLGSLSGPPLGFLGPDGGQDLAPIGLGSGNYSAANAARMATAELNARGRYYQTRFELEVRRGETALDLIQAVHDLSKAGARYIVADLPDELLSEVSDATSGDGVLLFNIAATGDELRNERCAAHVFHVIPSRAMLADALAQYLVRRNWLRWLVVSGPRERDRAFLGALQRSAQRYGAKIADTRIWKDSANMRRSAQAEFPQFTAKADYEVVVVSDETAQFGQFLQYHTDLPRPIAGTQGLVPTAWYWAFEQWGASQLNHRFVRAASAKMTSSDWAAWEALNAVGEAILHGNAPDPAAVAAYLIRDDAGLEGYKGVSLSFRPWDHQLRQPVLLAAPDALVSVSPQEGFLHPTTVLDTLGYDKPESRCHFH